MVQLQSILVHDLCGLIYLSLLIGGVDHVVTEISARTVSPVTEEVDGAPAATDM